jgi:hypothetical protein
VYLENDNASNDGDRCLKSRRAGGSYNTLMKESYYTCRGKRVAIKQVKRERQIDKKIIGVKGRKYQDTTQTPY